MHRRVVLSFAILLGLVATVQATPTINVGAHPNEPIGVFTIDVFVTGLGGSASTGGVDSLSGLDVIVSVGNPDPEEPAGAGEPKITNVDVVTGTVFAGNSTAAAPGQVLANLEQLWQVDTTTAGTGGANFIVADGKLFTITIDASASAPGSQWALQVLGINFGDTFNSSYSNSTGTGIIFAGSNGTFTLVPEPGSVVLGLFAAAGLGLVAIRRRRARG